MVTAFQQSAFQNDAFQIEVEPEVQPSGGGGGLVKPLVIRAFAISQAYHIIPLRLFHIRLAYTLVPLLLRQLQQGFHLIPIRQFLTQLSISLIPHAYRRMEIPYRIQKTYLKRMRDIIRLLEDI